MSRRTILFLVISVLVALGCVRLGLWQLSRHDERASHNALVEARLGQPPVDAAALPPDTAAVRYRRARAAGTYDYERELVLAARAHQGSPGVNILTPLRLPGRDTVLLVNRGWVYSPDGSSVDLARWREADGPVTVNGYLLPMAEGTAPAVGRPRTVQRVARADVERLVGGPVLPYYLVLTDPSAKEGAEAMARVQPPALSAGSHRSYAVQWFSFAVIALVGGAFITLRGRGRGGPTR